MTTRGLFIFLTVIIATSIIGAVIAVIASISGAVSAINDDEELITED